MKNVCLGFSACIGILGLTYGPAHAAETVTYTYDARGQLVTLTTSGTVNNGETVTITYDKADNRTNYTVTGA